jgi:uncharacterized protein (TIGR00251 family)
VTTEVPGGVVLAVRVIPRAGRSGLAGARNGALLVRLTAPPIEGAANTELIEVMAKAFGVAKRAISIESGKRGRLKRVRVDGVTLDDVNSKIKIPNSKRF